MSYVDNHIKFVPVDLWNTPEDPQETILPGNNYYTAAELAEREHYRAYTAATFLKNEKSNFFNALSSNYMDDCFGTAERERRIAKESDKRFDFVYRMSYNKAVGYINRRDKVQLYNGSSFNRKPTPKKELIAYNDVQDILLDAEANEIEIAYNLYKSTPGYGLQKHDWDNIKLLEKQQKQIDKGGKHSMSKRTKEKIRDKMLALFRACSGRKGYRADQVNFTLLTLTFIAKVEDNDGMDILNKFFTTIKKRYGNFNYQGVTERQQNGNIHFHILCDCRFPIGYINSLWVKQQFESGVINEEAQMQLANDYGTTFSNLHTEGKYNIVHEYLNPVDIDRVKTIDGVSMYLTKYVTKNDGAFDCAVSMCSRSISKLFTNATIDFNTFSKTGCKKKNQIKSKAGYYKNSVTGLMEFKPERVYVNETYYGEFCTINSIYNKKKFGSILEDMNDLNREILNQHEQTEKQEYNNNKIRSLLAAFKPAFRAQFNIDTVNQKDSIVSEAIKNYKGNSTDLKQSGKKIHI